jgi:DNA-binding response OmpR family regulator
MSNKRLVLIVDPDRIFADSLVEYLEGKGFLARGIHPDELGQHLDSLYPDAVILDAHTPESAAIVGRLQKDFDEAKIVVLTRQPHNLGDGDFTVLDRSHGLDYLTTTLGLILRAGYVASSNGSLLIANPRRSAVQLASYVKKEGYGVHVVGRSQDALDFLTDVPEIRVAVVDVDLPDTGGVHCLKQIIAGDNHPEVIITSANPDAEIARHCLALGAFDYMYEPFQESVVYGSVASAFLHWEYRHSRSLWGMILPRFLTGKKSTVNRFGGD